MLRDTDLLKMDKAPGERQSLKKRYRVIDQLRHSRSRTGVGRVASSICQKRAERVNFSKTTLGDYSSQVGKAINDRVATRSTDAWWQVDSLLIVLIFENPRASWSAVLEHQNSHPLATPQMLSWHYHSTRHQWSSTRRYLSFDLSQPYYSASATFSHRNVIISAPIGNWYSSFKSLPRKRLVLTVS